MNKPYSNVPLLKTKKFSTHHIQIFEAILTSRKTNRQLNVQFGYSINSHLVVDHSRKVMHKILAMEGLSKTEYREQIIYPRTYLIWWKTKLEKHQSALRAIAIKAEFYNPDLVFKQLDIEK